MRNVTCIAVVCALCLFGTAAFGQQIEGALSFSGVTTPTLAADTSSHAAVKMGTGTWMGFSGTVLVNKHIGFGAEVTWRARQSVYPVRDQTGAVVDIRPFRPIFYDFNAVFGTQPSKSVGFDAMAGFGVASTRFYTQFFTCTSFGCSNYNSTNHLMGHFAGRLKFYPTKGSIFVAPEVHLYTIRNNAEFSSGVVTRFGIALGYTFRPSE